MNDLDLSRVTPLRWQEMRRRVAALGDFLSLGDPAPSDREEAAQRIGLSIDQFNRLVRSWRIHSDPARLDGAGSLDRIRRTRGDGLEPEVQAIILRAIDEAGREAAPKDVYDRVVAACEDSGLDVPSNNMVWTRLMEARSKAGSLPEHDPEILVGRVWINLPIIDPSDEAKMVRPEVLLAVRLPERLIVAYQSDLKDGQPPILEDLPIPTQCALSIHADPRDTGDTSNFDRAGVVCDPRANTRLARLLGDSVGGLSLSFRLPRTSASRLLQNKLDRPLTAVDGDLAIRHAIDRHNKRLLQDGRG